MKEAEEQMKRAGEQGIVLEVDELEPMVVPGRVPGVLVNHPRHLKNKLKGEWCGYNNRYERTTMISSMPYESGAKQKGLESID